MKKRKQTTGTALLLGMLLAGSALFTGCSDNMHEGTPSWLASSIYGYLQDPTDGCTYNYTLRLIDDMGMTDVLNKTGSKTLFVADDSKFEEFFKNNTWGVTKYEDLTKAQKKLLLNNEMLNNAYLLEMLSSVSGEEPEEGMCMRRETSASAYDTIARIYPSEMPPTSYWDAYRNKSKGILLMRDNTTKPMIHFLPEFMKHNKITATDLSKLTNGSCTSDNDAYVNGKKVLDRDITCKNGYIHRVDGVMTSSDNMAETIRQQPELSIFSSLLDRFSAPYYSADASAEYNRLYDKNDSVYVLRYFAGTSAAGSDGLSTDPDGNTVDAQLTFDPGWNQYIYGNKDLSYDAGAILAPTNTALNNWWNAAGKPLQEMYTTWDNVPLKVLVKLLNICMVSSFVESVPSKFTSIVDNTTKTSIGITPDDVEQCYMACNGVVYKIGEVFSPADYSSVSFPALIYQDLFSVIYWGIENLNFEAYLNSMDSKYSLILPTNTAMLQYIDPCSYGKSTTVLYQFYFEDNKAKAHRYAYDTATKTIDYTQEMDDATDDQVQDRLEDLIDNMIVVGNIEDGHTYYKTKGGSTIKVAHAGQEGVMTVEGGYQIEHNEPITVTKIYDESEKGNGKTYAVNSQMPLSSERSTYSILRDNQDQFKEFYALMKTPILATSSGSYTPTTAGAQNISLFDAYNYTVFVPTNEVIRELEDEDILPTWNDYDSLTAEMFGGNQELLNIAKDSIADCINNFVKYHIIDNSVFIDGPDNNGVQYESSVMNKKNKRFYSVTVTSNDHKTMQLKGTASNNVCNVVTSGGFYNMMGREFWIDNTASAKGDLIYNASDVVVHQIDGALFYNDWQKTKKWTRFLPSGSSAKKSSRFKK